EYIDNLAYLLDMNAMLAVRDAEDAEALAGVSTVASAADKISDAAADIAMIVLRDIGIHPIVREAFEKTEEHLIRVRVNPNSVLAGRRLKDLELASRIGVDVIAIRRNNTWIINPGGEERIECGDTLIARGASLGVNKLRGLADGTLRELEG
ncbi:MAG: potassium channel family protein, partial [Candidatus Freyarchaeota archaeon]